MIKSKLLNNTKIGFMISGEDNCLFITPYVYNCMHTERIRIHKDMSRFLYWGNIDRDLPFVNKETRKILKSRIHVVAITMFLKYKVRSRILRNSYGKICLLYWKPYGNRNEVNVSIRWHPKDVLENGLRCYPIVIRLESKLNRSHWESMPLIGGMSDQLIDKVCRMRGGKYAEVELSDCMTIGTMPNNRS
jgi:hypothetical protein